MNKNYYCLLGVLLLVAGCTKADDNSELANPSATFCIDQGYSYEIRETPIGQNGYCVFNDSSECEAWAYFREECSLETAFTCKNLCGDDECQSVVCMAVGCPCAETFENCPCDCQNI